MKMKKTMRNSKPNPIRKFFVGYIYSLRVSNTVNTAAVHKPRYKWGWRCPFCGEEEVPSMNFPYETRSSRKIAKDKYYQHTKVCNAGSS